MKHQGLKAMFAELNWDHVLHATLVKALRHVLPDHEGTKASEALSQLENAHETAICCTYVQLPRDLREALDQLRENARTRFNAFVDKNLPLEIWRRRVSSTSKRVQHVHQEAFFAFCDWARLFCEDVVGVLFDHHRIRHRFGTKLTFTLGRYDRGTAFCDLSTDLGPDDLGMRQFVVRLVQTHEWNKALQKGRFAVPGLHFGFSTRLSV